MRTPVLLFALCATSLASGCAAASGIAAMGANIVTGQDRPIGASLDDAAAATTVKRRLMALDRTAYGQVDVRMAEGTLLLSGFTTTQEYKAMAEHIAWSQSSVDDVANEIVVGRGPGMLRSSLDTFIATQVRAKILSDNQIKGVNYTVETEKGVVYLMGLARSEEELQRVAEIASMVRGVDRVVSYVTVRRQNPAALPQMARGATIERRDPGAAQADAAAPGAGFGAAGPYADAADSGAGAPLVPQGRR